MSNKEKEFSVGQLVKITYPECDFKKGIIKKINEDRTTYGVRVSDMRILCINKIFLGENK